MAKSTPAIDGTMTLLDHLRELRSRLTKVSIAVLIGMFGGFYIVNSTGFIKYLILSFAGEQGVQTTEVTETFTTYLSTALTIGVAAAMPVIIYQLLAFLAPGLTRTERKWIFIGLPLVIFCFLGGIAFGWFVTAPAAIQFLINFGTENAGNLIENKPRLDDFLSILTRLLLINGIVFELPMIMFTLTKLGILNPRKLGRYRRYVVLITVVAAAILTPTGDPANLAFLAVPMYLLFEFGLLLGRLAQPKNAN